MNAIIVVGCAGLALLAAVVLTRRFDVRVLAVLAVLVLLVVLSDISLRNAARAAAIPDDWRSMTDQDRLSYRRGLDAVQAGVDNVRPLLDITSVVLAVIALVPTKTRRETTNGRVKGDKKNEGDDRPGPDPFVSPAAK